MWFSESRVDLPWTIWLPHSGRQVVVVTFHATNQQSKHIIAIVQVSFPRRGQRGASVIALVEKPLCQRLMKQEATHPKSPATRNSTVQLCQRCYDWTVWTSQVKVHSIIASLVIVSPHTCCQTIYMHLGYVVQQVHCRICLRLSQVVGFAELGAGFPRLAMIWKLNARFIIIIVKYNCAIHCAIQLLATVLETQPPKRMLEVGSTSSEAEVDARD